MQGREGEGREDEGEGGRGGGSEREGDGWREISPPRSFLKVGAYDLRCATETQDDIPG